MTALVLQKRERGGKRNNRKGRRKKKWTGVKTSFHCSFSPPELKMNIIVDPVYFSKIITN
jgi:hypothetical protein